MRKSKIAVYTLAATTLTLVLASQQAGAAVVLYDQGFESDANGWIAYGGSVSQVASGGGILGVTSANGSGHAEVTTGSSAGNGAYTKFGEYRYSWPGFIHQSLDIYIDPAAGAIGDGWHLDNAVNDNLNNNTGVAGGSDWLEAGGVGAKKTAAGTWSIAADGDGAAFTTAFGSALEITTAGWYTIVSEWNLNGDGVSVDRKTLIYNSSGAELYSNVQLQQVPLLGTFPIGGNSYGWLARSEGNAMTLAIDNSKLTVGVPEPMSISLLGIGMIGLVGFGRRRHRRIA